jgi:hypothetical protein
LIDLRVAERDPGDVGIKRVVAGLFVCGAAAIAACFGGTPTEGSTSQVILQSSTTSYNFGTVPVGSNKTSAPFIISSQGSADDDTIIDITESCGDFVLNLNPSPQGYRVYCDEGMGTNGSGVSGTMCIPNSYMFTADFRPVGAGSSSCTVRVDYMPTGTGSASFFNITLQGTGLAAASSLTINPPNGTGLSFGDIPIGQTSSAQPVTITNNGMSPLSVSGSASGPYLIAGVGNATFPSQTLGAGSSASYDVRCSPTMVGSQPGSLSFSSAAPAVGLMLSCRGVNATALNVSPNPGNFPATLTGKPVDLDVTITNTGAATTLVVGLTGASSELSFATGGNPNGQGLGAGSSFVAKLHYAAATDHPMSLLGTLNVNYSGGTNLGVAINGEALPGTLGVSPGTSIDFGPVCAGAKVDQAVTLYASAAGTVDVTSVSPPGAPFTATSTSGKLTGNHGSSLMLTASVMPVVAGDLSDKLVVHTNLTMPDQNVALTAKVLPTGVMPTPDVVHFGPNRVMQTTTTKEITVSNCGTSPITFSAARLEGASAAEFALVSELPAGAIDQRGSAKFLVVMTARSNGSKQAQLVFEHSGGTVAVDLDGNGFGGDDVSIGEDKTYYSCNAGGASAFGASLGLGLIALLRRRRR